jgi:3'-5' exonuclease
MPVFFDIETEGLPAAEAGQFMPDFEAPANYKDPEKIADNIAEQSAKWFERTALSPLTGRVLAIGLKDMGDDEVHIIHGEDEAAILREFVDLCQGVTCAPLVGYNILGFDLPFIRKRCWRHGIKVPSWWTAKQGWGKAPLVIDLMIEWQCGNYRDAFVKLDSVAKFLGLAPKTSDSLAKRFGEVYRTNQAEVLEYLERDVELVEEIYGRIFP